jgi:hypothetical protein
MINRTWPDRIREWALREFSAKYAERVVADLVDVASGNREGNRFECAVLARIFPESVEDCGEGPFSCESEARAFAESEVGACWVTRKEADGWHVLVLVRA